MTLSLKTLREMFPKGQPAFKPPFYVETTKDGEVHIYDADDENLLTFCTHTQLPIDDDRALAAEVSYWEIEAGRLVTALNAAYPPPAEREGMVRKGGLNPYPSNVLSRPKSPGPSQSSKLMEIDEESLDYAAREEIAQRWETHGPRTLAQYASQDIMDAQLLSARRIVGAYLAKLRGKTVEKKNG